ncbi:secreted RxLR effector protein 161-like [Arachis hypogaea]|uniref:secreted RxLR effector protein 161-like n=1 Tax=Arachis hypogaea TaxID=3818 RepID=UPI003B21E88D
MIGSLMYLTSSRPDIMQSVGVCSRFQSKPKKSHLSTVKRIIRYVLDFAGDRIDRRSTSGMCCFLGKSLIVWSSKKQATVALSTAEAEYIAASSCCSQLLWLKTQLADYKLNVSNIPLFCDNMNIQFVNSEGQLADIFTKPLIEERFCKLRTELGILTSSLFS